MSHTNTLTRVAGLATVIALLLFVCEACDLVIDVPVVPSPGLSPTATTKASVRPTTRFETDPARTTVATVVRVVDGDTIIVEIDNTEYRVRYIGIDTPELASNDRPAEDYAIKAAEFNENLVGGETVLLESDVSETDKYGRLLRYVWIDGLLANEELVRQGLAESKHYPPNTSRQELLDAAETLARQNSLGIWSSD